MEDSGDLNAVRSAVGGGPKKEEWAIKVDVNSPVQDFHKRIPDMAYKVRLLVLTFEPLLKNTCISRI